MLVDYHIHTPLCKHAEGEPEEYARRAVELGIAEIGFSDHSPMPEGYDPQHRMTRDLYPGYVESVLRVREKFPGLTVRLGVEADYMPGAEEYVREMVRQYDLDYVLGSIHYIDEWGFDNPDHIKQYDAEPVYEAYAKYYDLVARLAGTGLYDVLSHPDLIKKFGFRPRRDCAGLENRALDAVAKAGMAIEISTAGLRYPCREIYPTERILRAARERNIPVTFGSDAHLPDQVGENFDQALALARRAGYTEFVRFSGRNRESVPLLGSVL